MAPRGYGVDAGRGRLISPGTNARLHTTSFSNQRPRPEEAQDQHEDRLALALKMDRVQRVLDFDGFATFPRCKRNSCLRSRMDISRTTWNGTEWSNDDHAPKSQKEVRTLPNAPFKWVTYPYISLS